MGSYAVKSDWLCDSTTADGGDLCGSSDEADSMPLGAKGCFRSEDCWDEGEGYYYYYGNEDGARLACGWAYNRAWPTATPEGDEGRCVRRDACITYSEQRGGDGELTGATPDGSNEMYRFEFGWFVCDERTRFDAFAFMGLSWRGAEDPY